MLNVRPRAARKAPRMTSRNNKGAREPGEAVSSRGPAEPGTRASSFPRFVLLSMPITLEDYGQDKKVRAELLSDGSVVFNGDDCAYQDEWFFDQFVAEIRVRLETLPLRQAVAVARLIGPAKPLPHSDPRCGFCHGCDAHTHGCPENENPEWQGLVGCKEAS